MTSGRSRGRRRAPASTSSSPAPKVPWWPASRMHATTMGIACFGPTAAAATLEGSKAFAKEVMAAAGVPTGDYTVVDTVEAGLAAITGYPAVIKADGLAAGKGVVIATDEAEARAALEAMLVERRFGPGPVVVEEFLEGDELSLLALCDGKSARSARPCARLQAHRRRRHRAPTPAGWARTRRSTDADAARGSASCAERAPAGAGRAGAARDAVPRGPLRRADPDGGRPEGARVQRAVRRSGDAGGAPAAPQRPAGPAGPGDAPRRPCGRIAGVGPAGRGHAGPGVGRLSRDADVRPGDRRPRGRPGEGATSPMPARPGGTAASSPPGGGCST